MLAWLTLTIVFVVLVLIVARPFGIQEAWVAAVGAAIMVLLGILTVQDVVAVLEETANVLLFLLGMMVVTILAEQAGVFDRVAEACASLSRGSGLLLFCLLFGLGALVTVLLSLDATIVILTPVTYALVSRRRLDALPFMFACTFVANTASLALPISNLTNLLVYTRLHLGFVAFAARMVLPAIVAVAVNLAIFLWLFRDRLPARFETFQSPTLRKTDGWFVAAAVVLALTLVGVLALGLADLPLAWAALVGGVILLGFGVLLGRVRPKEVAREISWSLFVFVIGMFLVARGVEQEWLVNLSPVMPAGPGGALLTGVLGGALGSNVVNNVPLTILGMSLLSHMSGTAQQLASYGLLVGANIGPALTTYGSLATMLWLTLIRRRGIEVSTMEYMKVGIVTVPPVLVAATGVLWLELR